MNQLELIRSKIAINKESLTPWLNTCRQSGKKIIFTNGCFDIVHRGHVEYLAQAAEMADEMVLGLNTDASVRRLKGESRPLQDEMARAEILAAFQFISKVVLFDEDTPYELIQFVQPDVLVKGSDYNATDIVGCDVVMSKGGQVKTLDFVPGYSTSSIVEKIRAAY